MSIGYHVSKTAGGKKRSMSEAITEAIEYLQNYDFKHLALQIFVTGPQSFKEILTPEDKDKCAKIIKETQVTAVVHGAYTDNPWNKSPGSVHNIKQELKIAFDIGATGVIVHLGAGASNDENLSYVLTQISKLDKIILNNVILWLEIHTAKASSFTYETPEKIKVLFDRIEKLNLDLKIGICIDTAHLYSCGVALNTYQKAKSWLEMLDKLIPDIPKMLHLNDSLSTLGSGKDIHAVLTEGNLWGSINAEESGINAVLAWAENNNIVVILERNFIDVGKDLNLIHSMGYFKK